MKCKRLYKYDRGALAHITSGRFLMPCRSFTLPSLPRITLSQQGSMNVGSLLVGVARYARAVNHDMQPPYTPWPRLTNHPAHSAYPSTGQKRNGAVQLRDVYEDEDGAATEKSEREYSDVLPKRKFYDEHLNVNGMDCTLVFFRHGGTAS
jgi:hypothetical protein